MNVDPRYDGPLNPKTPVPSGESRIIIYGYVPSIALAAVAMATFAAVLGVHSFYLIRQKKSRSFESLLVAGCAMELVGYAFRAASHSMPYTIAFFVVQYFMIVCAPIFFSAALYLSLSRTSRLYSADHILPAPPKWIVTFFVTDDIVTTALQVTGASLIGTAESSIGRGESPSVSPDTANHILTAGLAIQCATFLGFLCIVGYSAINNRKISHAGIKSETASFERSSPAKVPTLFFAILTITSLLVWLRTLFRLAETAQGLFSFASTSEALFGTLEFAPIILTLLLWAAWPLHKIRKFQTRRPVLESQQSGSNLVIEDIDASTQSPASITYTSALLKNPSLALDFPASTPFDPTSLNAHDYQGQS